MTDVDTTQAPAAAQSLSFPLTVPIERPDGRPVTDFRAPEDWRRQRSYRPDEDETQSAISIDPLIEEEHHKIYGRPWLLGRYVFDHLVENGLKPTDKVLDLGCGNGRVGVWLIRYLEPGNYFGLDSHLPSLVAFSAYELVLHGLAHKKPRLLHSEAFDVASFGATFDVSLELSVTVPRNGRQAYANLAPHMRSGGLCYMLKEDWKFPDEVWAELGYRQARTDTLHFPLFEAAASDIISTDEWVVAERL